MKRILLVVFYLLPLSLFAQSASDYFHTAANHYVKAEKKPAQKAVQEGIRKFPNDSKLKTLAGKINELPDPENDQQNQQNRNNQQEQQQDDKDNQQKNNQNQQQQQNQDKKDQQNQQQQAADRQKQEMNKRQLDALQQNERQTQKKVQGQEVKVGTKGQQEKDW